MPSDVTPTIVRAAPRSMRESVAAALYASAVRWSPTDPALDLSQRALVFAPHPDDEVLGCGGTVALKVDAGAEVKVVVMTDGRTSHAALIDAPSLIALRREEAMEASRHLGLQPSSYTFLDFEDNRLRAHFDAARARVEALLEQHDPVQVFVPHRRDRLPDHVSTFDIVDAALARRGRRTTVLEYPVWLWNTWPWTRTLPSMRRLPSGIPRLLRDGFDLAFGCRTRIDITTVAARKRSALAAYRSQVQRYRGDPRWPILADVAQGDFMARFETGLELFRRTERGVN